MPVRDEGKDFFELRLERSFLGVYAAETGTRPGIDYFCFGVDQYEPSAALTALKSAAPTGQLTLENENQVYVRDPDGVRVQFADARYKPQIAIEQEVDGRWIAEVEALPGVTSYGITKTDAVARAQALALRVLAERLEQGEAVPEFLDVSFQAA